MLENTKAALDDAADLVGTLVGTFQSGKGVIAEVAGLVTSSHVRSDIAGLMTSVPAAASEINAQAKGGVFTIVADAPEFIADAVEAWTKFQTALAEGKGLTVVVTQPATK